MPLKAWVLVALVLAASSAPAATPSLAGVVTDLQGRPIAGATAHLAAAGASVRSDASGRFALSLGPAEDVLTLLADGFGARSFAVGAGDAPRTVTLHPEDLPGEPARFGGDLPVPLDVRRAGISLTGASAALPFEVLPGANGGTFNLTWSEAETQLLVNVVHQPTGATFGYLRGRPPLTAPMSSALLRDLAGSYALEVQLFEGGGEAITARAAGEVTYGPWRAKVVEGKQPEVVHATWPQPTVMPRNPSMDITAIRFTNETADQVDVEMDLAELRASDSNRLVSLWSVHWTYESHWALFFRRDANGTGEEWYAGDCDASTCSIQYRLHGRLDLGEPGRITWHVPKHLIGSPADGTALHQPYGLNFMIPAEKTPVRRTPIPTDRAGMVVSDSTNPRDGLDYTFGATQYLGPAAAARADAVGGTAWPGGHGPWLLLVGAVFLAGAGLQARRRRGMPARLGPGGRYQPLRLLGTGASGRTSLARDRITGGFVAVKQCAAPGAASRERLLREAHIGRRISHPHVVRVLDVDDRQGSYAIVMEYVPGGSLQTRLDHDPPGREEALCLWGDVLAGLEAIHAAGIVHRDVKPSNILLTEDGRAKVADFGVARAVTEETLGPGGPLGTPLYMAPEVLHGREPTNRSDLYSASAVAYRMLAGRPHLEVGGSDVWTALLDRRGRRAALPVPELPGWLNDLLAAGLAEDPHRRPASATAMLAALARHTPGGTRASPPLPPP